MMPHWRAKGGQKKFKFIGNGAATGHTHTTNTHILYTSVAQNQIMEDLMEDGARKEKREGK